MDSILAPIAVAESCILRGKVEAHAIAVASADFTAIVAVTTKLPAILAIWIATAPAVVAADIAIVAIPLAARTPARAREARVLATPSAVPIMTIMLPIA
jgi:hypothetical protein